MSLPLILPALSNLNDSYRISFEIDSIEDLTADDIDLERLNG